MKPAQKMWLPPLFFALSIAASLGLAGGVLGLFAPDVFPPLARPEVSYALIGLGVFFEVWSIAVLISSSRAHVAKRSTTQ